jgi:hypothetical protein
MSTRKFEVTGLQPGFQYTETFDNGDLNLVALNVGSGRASAGSSGGPAEEKAIAWPQNPLRRFMKGKYSRPECNSTPSARSVQICSKWNSLDQLWNQPAGAKTTLPRPGLLLT